MIRMNDIQSGDLVDIKLWTDVELFADVNPEGYNNRCTGKT